MLAVEISGLEMVDLGTVVPDAARHDDHRQHLHQFERRRHCAKAEDVLSMPNVGVRRQTFNVLRVVEQPVAFRRHEPSAVLTEALQATPCG